MARQRVDFTVTQNQQVRVLCDDGTEFRIDLVVSAITRTDDKLPDGQPKYELRLQPIIEQLAPEGPIDVRKLAGGA